MRRRGSGVVVDMLVLRQCRSIRHKTADGEQILLCVTRRNASPSARGRCRGVMIPETGVWNYMGHSGGFVVGWQRAIVHSPATRGRWHRGRRSLGLRRGVPGRRLRCPGGGAPNEWTIWRERTWTGVGMFGMGSVRQQTYFDTGNASRFFYTADWSLDVAEQLAQADPVRYCAKASRAERDSGLENRNNHPCLKPISLCTWLATLLLPPAAYAPRRLLVPFSGTSSEYGGLRAGFEMVFGDRTRAAIRRNWSKTCHMVDGLYGTLASAARERPRSRPVRRLRAS